MGTAKKGTVNPAKDKAMRPKGVTKATPLGRNTKAPLASASKNKSVRQVRSKKS